MGLKKEKYVIEKLNIEITPAYAMIGKIEIDNDSAIAEMKIHKTRADLEQYEPLESININCNLDRNKPIYEQIYIEAKNGIFKEWENDILNLEGE